MQQVQTQTSNSSFCLAFLFFYYIISLNVMPKMWTCLKSFQTSFYSILCCYVNSERSLTKTTSLVMCLFINMSGEVRTIIQLDYFVWKIVFPSKNISKIIFVFSFRSSQATTRLWETTSLPTDFLSRIPSFWEWGGGGLVCRMGSWVSSILTFLCTTSYSPLVSCK